MKPLDGKRVLIFVGPDYEDLELWYPKLRLIEAGASVTVAGPENEEIYKGKHGYPCRSNASIAEVSAAKFDAVVIPGGWMPDRLRRDDRVLDLVREFVKADKPIATICHGPQINISAGVCKGIKMTSSPGVKDDLMYAGAVWVNEPVVVDGVVISSRGPDDLPHFCAALIEALSRRKK